MTAFDWRAEAQRLLDDEGMGVTSEQYIAQLRLALRRVLDALLERDAR